MSQTTSGDVPREAWRQASEGVGSGRGCGNRELSVLRAVEQCTVDEALMDGKQRSAIFLSCIGGIRGIINASLLLLECFA